MLRKASRSYFPKREPYQELGREVTEVESSPPAACDPSLMAVDEADADDLGPDENLNHEDPGDGLDMEDFIQDDGGVNDCMDER
jgi:hypothetical protein